MGNRGQVIIVEDGSPNIYLYSHCGGSELPRTVQAALKRGQGRWGDPPYLTRIIFSEMIKDEILGETGFGIATSYQDSTSSANVVVDVEAGTVSPGDRFTKTFAEYIEVDSELL